MPGETNQNTTMPRRIVQTGKSFSLPPLYRAATVNIKLLNPDFEYLFFDDVKVNAFLEEKFPEFMDVFNTFKYRIQQIDFFRYLAIYHYGGFYFDLDVLLFEKLSCLLKHSCIFPFERIGISKFFKNKYNMHWDVGNYAFGAIPRHPFIEKIIENCCRAQKDPEWVESVLKSIPGILRKDSYVLCTTGPLLVTRTYAENPEMHSSVEILMPDDICDRKNWNKFGEYGIHLINSSWRRRGKNLYGLYRIIWKYFYLKTEDRTIRLARLRPGGQETG